MTRTRLTLLGFGLIAITSLPVLPARAGSEGALDRTLRLVLRRQGITPLHPGSTPPAAKVRLGQMLFFDKLLGGNRDTACATCHHPRFMSDDGLSLSIGTMGQGLGPDRIKGADRPFVARNATEIFDRGSPDWYTMFWDGRVEVLPTGGLKTPAKDQLPPGLDNILAAQAMFPVTGRDEMRGDVGDPNNELSAHDDSDFTGIWSDLMIRIMSISEYHQMFRDAYPATPLGSFGFQHAANAIAAFESTAFASTDSPWDRYLAGDRKALSTSAKRGALLFFGRARCAGCHSGNLLTDQDYHNIAVPQLGPGKPPATPHDFGRGGVTGNLAQRFAFRTPPLRNVTVTGPWMHNGAFTSLEGAVRHHLNPVWSLLHYDPSQLVPELQPTVLRDRQTIIGLLETLDPLARVPVRLSQHEFRDLMAFLESLTSPTLDRLEAWIPSRVPSGLPVDK